MFVDNRHSTKQQTHVKEFALNSTRHSMMVKQENQMGQSNTYSPANSVNHQIEKDHQDMDQSPDCLTKFQPESRLDSVKSPSINEIAGVQNSFNIEQKRPTTQSAYMNARHRSQLSKNNSMQQKLA